MKRHIAKMRLIEPASAARLEEEELSVQVTGDLTDGDAVTNLLVLCRTALHRARHGLIVDLTKVDAADTKLVAALVILRKWASSIGVELELRLPRCVHQWLSICRLEGLLSAEASV